MLLSISLATYQAAVSSETSDTWAILGSGAEAALAVIAVGSLWLAWRAGLFDRKAEKQRRQPQIGFELVLLPPDEAMRTATPPAQLPAQSIFFNKALERDPQDWPQYPKQKYSLVVDNGGLGPAVRVTVPYTLTVWDIDQHGTRRKDETASHGGTFEALHVGPSLQKRTSHVVETTYFPAFKLELGTPSIVGLGGTDESERWTDAGNPFRFVDLDNNAMWTGLRTTSWIPSRPASVDVHLVSEQRQQGTVVLTVVATPKSATGAAIPWTLEAWVTGGTGAFGPYLVVSGTPREIRVGQLPPGSYTIIANAQQASGQIQVTVN